MFIEYFVFMFWKTACRSIIIDPQVVVYHIQLVQLNSDPDLEYKCHSTPSPHASFILEFGWTIELEANC